MKKKNGLIIASHGYFANEALNSVKMISGDIDEEIIRTYSMTLGKDLDTVVEEINDEILNLSRSVENVYLFTDLIGGTPSNASLTNSLNHSELNINVVNGFNLPLLLSFVLNINNDIDIDFLLEEAKLAIIKVNNKLNEEGGEL